MPDSNIQIVKAQKNDCADMATIYVRALPDSFLGQLGPKFIRLLFRAMIDFGMAVALVAKENGKVVGYVCGVKNINQFYKHFYQKYYLKVVGILFRQIVNPHTLSKILENFLYPQKNDRLVKAELLSIAIEPNYQGKNIGGKLFNGFNSEMEKIGVKKYKIVVGGNLDNANRFYNKMGCLRVGEIEVHENEPSNLYIHQIK